MATREEKIKLDVTGADQSVRDLAKVGGTAKAVGDTVKGMGQEATQASKKIDDLGDEAKQTADQLNKLEREVLEAKAALKALGDEYARTTDPKIGEQLDAQSRALAKLETRARAVAKANRDISGGPAKSVDPIKAIQQQYQEMDRLAGVRKRIAADEEAAYKDNDIFDRRSRRDRQGFLRNTLDKAGGLVSGGASAVASQFNDIGVGTAVKAGVGALAAPAIGAVSGGAVLAGAGIGAVGAGVAGAVMGDPARFKKEWGDAIGGVANRWKELTARDVAGPLSSSIKILKSTLDSLDLEGLSKNAAKFIIPLTQGISGFIGPLVKGFDTLVAKAGPVITVLEKDLPLLGQAFEKAFGDIGDGADGGARALDSFVSIIGTTIIAVGKFVGAAEDMYGWLDRNIPLLGSGEEATLSYGRALDGASTSTSHYVDTEKLLTDAARAATDALRDQFGILLSSQEATDRATQANMALTESFKQNGWTIEGNSKAALENREALRSTIRAWEDEQDAAIAAGNGSKEAIASANQTLLRHLEDLRATLRAHGQNTEAVDAYIDKLKVAMGLKLSDQTVTIRVNYRTNGLPAQMGSRYQGDDMFASGGTKRVSGVALVGEEGPELVQLNTGDHVFNAADTARIRAASSSSPSGGGMGGGGYTPQLPPMSVIEQALAAVVLRLMQEGHLPVPATAVSG